VEPEGDDEVTQAVGDLGINISTVMLVLVGHVDVALVVTEVVDVCFSLLDDGSKMGDVGACYCELLLSNGSTAVDSGGETLGNGDHDSCVVLISHCQVEGCLCCSGREWQPGPLI
jgi:hypothetical protein